MSTIDYDNLLPIFNLFCFLLILKRVSNFLYLLSLVARTLAKLHSTLVLFSRELISTIAKLSMDDEEASNDERKRLPTFKLTVRFCFKGTLKALVN